MLYGPKALKTFGGGGGGSVVVPTNGFTSAASYNQQVVVPTGAVSGQSMFLFASYFYNAAGTCTCAGWASQLRINFGGVILEVYHKLRAATAEGPYNVTLGGGAGDSLLSILAVTGAALTTPISVQSTVAGGATPTLPGVTVPDAGSLLVAAYSAYFDAPTSLSGTPVFTSRGGASYEQRIFTAPVGAGATGNITPSGHSGTDHAGALFAIRPA